MKPLLNIILVIIFCCASVFAENDSNNATTSNGKEAPESKEPKSDPDAAGPPGNSKQAVQAAVQDALNALSKETSTGPAGRAKAADKSMTSFDQMIM